MPGLSIGEVAKRAGVRPSAIRYYEKIGLLPKTMRVNGRRCYDESTLDRLAIVRFAKRAGFSIAELRILLKDTPQRPLPERWRALAHAKLTQLEQLIAEASAVRQTLLETLEQRAQRCCGTGQSGWRSGAAPCASRCANSHARRNIDDQNQPSGSAEPY